MERELARLCPCGIPPLHTIGWCEALTKASQRKIVYSSKKDLKVKRESAVERS